MVVTAAYEEAKDRKGRKGASLRVSCGKTTLAEKLKVTQMHTEVLEKRLYVFTTEIKPVNAQTTATKKNGQ